MKKIVFLTIIASLIFASVSIYAIENTSNDESAAEDRWKSELIIYTHLATEIKALPSLAERSPAGPIKTDIFELIRELDLFDELTAFSGHFETWNKWGFLLNADWMKIQDGKSRGPFSIGANIEILQVDAALGYEFINFPFSEDSNHPAFRLIGWVGPQYNYFENSLDFSRDPITIPILWGIPVPGTQRKFGGDRSWVEPVVGLGFGFQLTEKLTLGARGQMGGFVGETNENWWVIVGFDYRISERWSAKLAYRYWSYEYQTGSGNSEFGLDMTMSGPFVGVGFHF